MTGKRSEERKALDRLTEALVDDLLNTPDSEVLAEFRADGGDPDRSAAEVAALFECTLLKANKARLAAAKADAAASKGNVATTAPIEMDAARRRLRAILASPKLAGALTLAARKETDLSDADVVALLVDLDDLGVVPPDDADD